MQAPAITLHHHSLRVDHARHPRRVRRRGTARRSRARPSLVPGCREPRRRHAHLDLRSDAVLEWLERDAVKDRLGELNTGFQAVDERAQDRAAVPRRPVRVAAHPRALADPVGGDALRLSGELYPGTIADWQGKRFGLMLYTASSDAEGTLRRARLAGPPHRLAPRRRGAVGRTLSNDPVCAQHSPVDAMEGRWLHGAACRRLRAHRRRRRARCATTCSTGRSSSQHSPCRTPRSSVARIGVIESLVALPAHVRDRLARALEAGTLRAPYSEVAVQAALGGGLARTDVAVVAAALRVLAEHDISGAAVALALRAAASAAAAITRPDLVSSGPPVTGLHARDTRQVYDELVGFATRTLSISAYAYFDGLRAFETLADRMDAIAGLSASSMLTSSAAARPTPSRGPRSPLRSAPLEPRMAGQAAAPRRLLRPQSGGGRRAVPCSTRRRSWPTTAPRSSRPPISPRPPDRRTSRSACSLATRRSRRRLRGTFKC